MKLIAKLARNRTVQYLVFWLISFLFLVNYFTRGYEIALVDVVYTLLFHISLVFVVSVNSFLLIPRYMARGKYLVYGSLVIAPIIAAIGLNIFTFRYLSNWIFPGYYFVSYYTWWELLEFMVIYIGLTSMLEFSKSWFREMEVRRELAEMEQEKIQTELKALRSQVNPHFLFNSLNHIYSLAVKQSKDTAGSVLQLSELLRYAIKNMDMDLVPLKDELEYISTFVEWHKSRTGNGERIRFTCPTVRDDLKIAPLLLIAFVEKSFPNVDFTASQTTTSCN